MLSGGALVGRHYRVVRLLGRGGMGEVYEAVHEPLARRVALKTIRPDVASDPAALARFRREAETAASLGHPNIVQVTDWQALPGEPAFLVMEYLEGVALSEVITRERTIAPARAVFIALQVLSGLAAAHAAGIVHRDIKPGNIFLLSTFAVSDLVKVVDFGLAKMVESPAATAQQKLTELGQVLGTLAYMAPEQAQGGVVDARADLFAVGATLFHALSGIRPTDAIVPGQPRATLSSMAPWIDPALAAVVDKAMDRDPARRFATAQEMADALARFPQDADPSLGSTTLRDAAPRFADETVGASNVHAPPHTVPFRSTPPLPPMRAPQPVPPPAQAAWIPWAVGAVVVLSVLVTAGASILGARSATSPKAIEQNLVSTTKYPACPSPERCISRAEGGVTYPVCTKQAPMGPVSVGSNVLVVGTNRAYAGYVEEASPDGVHYVVQQILGDDADDVTADAIHLLCDPKAKRKPVD